MQTDMGANIDLVAGDPRRVLMTLYALSAAGMALVLWYWMEYVVLQFGFWALAFGYCITVSYLLFVSFVSAFQVWVKYGVGNE